MTIQERLCFIRAGYSAQDIAGFEAAEAAAASATASEPTPATATASEPTPATAPAEETPAWAAALAKSIQDMTKTMQANNVRFVDMGDPVSVQQQAVDVLAAYVRGGKTKNGGANK